MWIDGIYVYMQGVFFWKSGYENRIDCGSMITAGMVFILLRYVRKTGNRYYRRLLQGMVLHHRIAHVFNYRNMGELWKNTLQRHGIAVQM